MHVAWMLAASIAFQRAVAGMAIRLARMTRELIARGLIATALVLMAVRRIIPPYTALP
jgi:hypothetical protein